MLCDGSGGGDVVKMSYVNEWCPHRVRWLNAVKRGWFLRLRNISRKSASGELELCFRNSSHLIRVPDCAASVVAHIKPNLHAALIERLEIANLEISTLEVALANSQELENELADDDNDIVLAERSGEEEKVQSEDEENENGFDLVLSQHPTFLGTRVTYNRAPLSKLDRVYVGGDSDLVCRCWVRVTAIYPSDVRDFYRKSTKDFRFALRLEDMSGVVTAWACGMQAEQFLNMRACDLRSNESKAKKLRDQVRSLMSPCAWFSCCLFRSFGRAYIFGTSIIKKKSK